MWIPKGYSLLKRHTCVHAHVSLVCLSCLVVRYLDGAVDGTAGDWKLTLELVGRRDWLQLELQIHRQLMTVDIEQVVEVAAQCLVRQVQTPS